MATVAEPAGTNQSAQDHHRPPQDGGRPLTVVGASHGLQVHVQRLSSGRNRHIVCVIILSPDALQAHISDYKRTQRQCLTQTGLYKLTQLTSLTHC